jgi:hypothetical protein
MLQNGNGSLLRLKVHEKGSGLKKKTKAKKALKHIMGIKGKHSWDFQDELTL